MNSRQMALHIAAQRREEDAAGYDPEAMPAEDVTEADLAYFDQLAEENPQWVAGEIFDDRLEMFRNEY